LFPPKVTAMDNVIPLRRSVQPGHASWGSLVTVEDDELDIRLWEQVMSGRRGSPDFQRIESEIHRRRRHPSAA
jgi:hypothetical protein